MPDPTDLANQKKMADDHKRKTDELISKGKVLLKQQIASLDAQLSALQTQRDKAASELSRLG